MKRYDFVTVGYPHIPTAVWTADEAKEIAADVAPLVRKLLTS